MGASSCSNSDDNKKILRLLLVILVPGHQIQKVVLILVTAVVV
jgi:hypothetical protein